MIAPLAVDPATLPMSAPAAAPPAAPITAPLAVRLAQPLTVIRTSGTISNVVTLRDLVITIPLGVSFHEACHEAASSENTPNAACFGTPAARVEFFVLSLVAAGLSSMGVGHRHKTLR